MERQYSRAILFMVEGNTEVSASSTSCDTVTHRD